MRSEAKSRNLKQNKFNVENSRKWDVLSLRYWLKQISVVGIYKLTGKIPTTIENMKLQNWIYCPLPVLPFFSLTIVSYMLISFRMMILNVQYRISVSKQPSYSFSHHLAYLKLICGWKWT